MGYRRAGFDEIVGVDHRPQPNYPFAFIQADALRPPVSLEAFDMIHASPPCQALSSLRTASNAGSHLNLIPETRALLESSGLPYVIENVEHAAPHLRDPLRLCGTSFGLRVEDGELRRHRLFEVSTALLGLPCSHQLQAIGVYGHLTVSRHLNNRGRRPQGDRKAGKAEARVLMGIDWPVSDAELVQAIPPAFTEYLGSQILERLEARS